MISSKLILTAVATLTISSSFVVADVLYDFGGDGAAASSATAGISASAFSVGPDISSSDFNSSSSGGSSSGNHLRVGGFQDDAGDYLTFTLDTVSASDSLNFTGSSLTFEYRMTGTGLTGTQLFADTGSGFSSIGSSALSNTSTWLTSSVIDLSTLGTLGAGQEVIFRLIGSGATGGSQQNFDVFNVSGLTVVPEPGTFALLAGFCGLIFVMLKRRHS